MSVRRSFLRGAAGFAVGGVFLWLALRGTDLEEVSATWKAADLRWLALGLIPYAASIALRALRWWLLVREVVVVRLAVLAEVLVVGYAVNNVLPARLGELFRADYAKRRCGITRSTALGTIVVERLLDLCVVVLSLATGLWLIEAAAVDPGHLRTLRLLVLAGAGILLVALAAVILALPRRARPAWFPQGVARRLGDLVEGLRSVRSAGFAKAAALAVIVWILEATALWTAVRSVGADPSVAQMLVILGAANLSTLLPTAPAYLGSYQFAMVVLFLAFGWAGAAGITAATAVQLFLFGPLTLLGLIFLLMRSGKTMLAANRD